MDESAVSRVPLWLSGECLADRITKRRAEAEPDCQLIVLPQHRSEAPLHGLARLDWCEVCAAVL
jgi:hypothetical protein